MAAWGEHVDVLMAMVSAGGNSPFDQFQRAQMLAKMRMAAPIILHSGIAITPEEYAARLITGIKVFGTPIGCKMDWNTDMIKMSDLSYAVGGLTHEEYKVLNARCNGRCRSSSQCRGIARPTFNHEALQLLSLVGLLSLDGRLPS